MHIASISNISSIVLQSICRNILSRSKLSVMRPLTAIRMQSSSKSPLKLSRSYRQLLSYGPSKPVWVRALQVSWSGITLLPRISARTCPRRKPNVKSRLPKAGLHVNAVIHDILSTALSSSSSRVKWTTSRIWKILRRLVYLIICSFNGG